MVRGMPTDATARRWDRERLELALQAAGLGEFEWVIDQNVFLVSPRMAAITGLAAGAIPAQEGWALNRMLHPDDQAPTRAAVEAQLANTGRYMVECRAIRAIDGRTIWVRAVGEQVRDDKGRPTGIIGVVQDITDEKLED